MKTDRLYYDEIPTDIFSQAKYLFQAKGMTVKDIIEEIESKTWTPLPAFIKDKLQEESYKW